MRDITPSDIIRDRYRNVVGVISFQVKMQSKEGRRSLAKEMHEHNLIHYRPNYHSNLSYYGVPRCKSRVIDRSICFKNSTSTPDSQYSMFTQMVKNFDFDSISELIRKHSIFGAAYLRACLRVSKTGPIVSPQKDVVMDEFRKILIKAMCEDFKIDDEIYNEYVKKK